MSRKAKKKYIVYILKCRDGSFYTGYTNNMERRLQEHNSGKGSRYTRGRAPVKLVHIEKFRTRKEAVNRELEIKKFTRKAKRELIRSQNSSK